MLSLFHLFSHFAFRIFTLRIFAFSVPGFRSFFDIEREANNLLTSSDPPPKKKTSSTLRQSQADIQYIFIYIYLYIHILIYGILFATPTQKGHGSPWISTHPPAAPSSCATFSPRPVRHLVDVLIFGRTLVFSFPFHLFLFLSFPISPPLNNNATTQFLPPSPPPTHCVVHFTRAWKSGIYYCLCL